MPKILLFIVVSQFLCTTLWFAGNSIIGNIIQEHHLGQDFVSHITSAIQFGFIVGTLFFAFLSIPDRYSPSVVFFVSAVLAGFFNLGISLTNLDVNSILLLRFLTGFFLAGIYPVGMKIASDYFEAGLGKSLGFLVGALVVGTAFPYLLKSYLGDFPWKYVIYSTTILSVFGGLVIFLLVPDGPYRKPSTKMQLSAFSKGFKIPAFRAAAFGYFGHMWELYSFWAFVPIMLTAYNSHFTNTNLNVSLLSFLIIAFGALACVVSGFLSQQYGSKKIAQIALLVSGLCCVSSPLFLLSTSTSLFLGFLFLWSFAVIADSPLLSTLVAQNAPVEVRGSSLTIVNCIGFSITILSIQFINLLSAHVRSNFVFTLLAIGPILGLIALFNKK